MTDPTQPSDASGFSAAHRALLDTVPAGAGARIHAEDVVYDHEGTELTGYVAIDEAVEGRRPAVIVVHDWTGLREYPKTRAHMLARLGVLAFAADVYGTGVRPTGDDAAATAGSFYQDLPLLRARVRAAYDLVAADPRVDPERIVVIGYCFGGTAAIELARSGAALAGAVSFHGALVAHEPADVAAIAAPLLVLTGGADDVVPDAAVAAFQDELRTRPDLDWQVTTYAGAPHAFTLPEIPNYRDAADRRSWAELVRFLDETTAGTAPA